MCTDFDDNSSNLQVYILINFVSLHSNDSTLVGGGNYDDSNCPDRQGGLPLLKKNKIVINI